LTREVVLENRFYSKKTLELFLNPPHTGILEGHNGRGEATNTACSDHAVITLLVEDGVVKDARFQTRGCAAAIAAGAATAIMVRGRTLEEAAGIDVDTVVEFLEGLPEAKKSCSVIAPQALERAIEDFRTRK